MGQCAVTACVGLGRAITGVWVLGHRASACGSLRPVQPPCFRLAPLPAPAGCPASFPPLHLTGRWDDWREEVLGCRVGSRGWAPSDLGVLVDSGAAATAGTVSALGAAPSRCPSPPWGPQVRQAVGQGGRPGKGVGAFPTEETAWLNLFTSVTFLTKSNYFSSFPKSCTCLL